MERRKELHDEAVTIIVDAQSYVYLYNPDIVQAWQPTLGELRGARRRSDPVQPGPAEPLSDEGPQVVAGYVVRRVLQVLVVMLGVSIVAFAVPRPRSSWSACRRR
ncbi:MAG TPA: hypothetical protein VFZ70_16645 [Euzebyales bacterium]